MKSDRIRVIQKRIWLAAVMSALLRTYMERGGMQRQDIHPVRGDGVCDGILVIHLVVGVAVDDDILDPGALKVFLYALGSQRLVAGEKRCSNN